MSGGSSAFRVVFGDQVVLIGEERERRSDVVRVIPGERVVLITEEGSEFRRQFSDTEIAFEDSPFLLVAPDKLPDGFEPRHGYRVETLREDTVVYEDLEESSETRDEIADLVAEVDRVRYCQNMTALAIPRMSTSAGYQTALGIVEAALPAGWFSLPKRVTVGSRSTWNLVVRRNGSSSGPQILVCAHLDALNGPGADDNATGCAALLELAHLFANRTLQKELWLVFFGGEEQNLHGSRQFVKVHSSELSALEGVVNLDTIGRLCCGRKRKIFLAARDREAPVIEDLCRAVPYGDLDKASFTSKGVASDHEPFLDEGIDAAMIIERATGTYYGSDSSCGVIHTGGDLPGCVDCDFAVEVARIAAAYVAAKVL